MQAVSKQRRKKKVGSYPYITVVFSITLALFVIGLCGLFILYADKLSRTIRANIEIQVYLDRYITQEQTAKLIQSIKARRYVQVTEGRTQLIFISKEEAAKVFIKETGENFDSFLGENPLRDALVIKIKPEFYDSRQMRLIKKDLEKLSGVFEATYVEDLVDKINRNIVRITFILIIFAGILLLTISILINNTIKLAMFSQRFLIRSMQLVGATPSFIRSPFLLRAALHGFLSGALASLLLWGLMQYAYQHIEELKMLDDPLRTVTLFASLCLLGSFIGLISSYRSVNRYLALSLDDLY